VSATTTWPIFHTQLVKRHEVAERTIAFEFAGGIGITPFRSILVDAAKRKLPQRIFVFYSNRRPEDAPF
jgi:ferredoxin-NADP reductase